MNYNSTSFIRITLSRVDYDAHFFNELVHKSTDWKEQFELFNNHTIAPLVSGLNQYVQDNNIKKAWKETVYSNIYAYSNLVKKQKRILDAFQLNQLPVVVVKGTSAAKYYPKPQLRTMGDIDLFVRPEDYADAVCA
jgi:hypothetical protein